MRAFTFSFLRNGVLLLCLFAPSAWMIATIPPLWRDVDAYNQVTRDPLVATFWGHAPAYCYAAKVPLFLGEQIERWRGVTAAGTESGSSQLTDTGVGLLIIAQHLALCSAALYFLLAISRFFLVRVALALTWASNALLYTFAHCVGSESLGVILVVLLAGKGLRLIRSRGEPSWRDWYVFAVGLCLCLLTRHINSWLILLLPVAFLFSWAQNRIASFASGERKRLWRRRLGARDIRQAVIAIAIGIACSMIANSLTRGLARKTRMHPHSRMGYTFLWRLQFLKTLPPATRVALLEKVTARTQSREVRQLVTLLGQMHAEGGDPVAAVLTPRAIPLLFPGEAIPPWEKLDVALNDMAMAFLLPPTSEHLQAARADFAAAMKMSVTEIEDMLFETTGYFFDHKQDMAGCAGLVTFRNASAEIINGLPSRHPYFHLWRGMTYTKAFLIWCGSLLVFLFLARRNEMKAGAVCGFAMALVGIGLLTILSACLLTEFLPRYALPMWQLLLVSFYIFTGRIADILVNGGTRGSASRTCRSMSLRNSQKLARSAIGWKQSAGQLPKLG